MAFDIELKNDRPKTYRVRLRLICLALAYRGLIGLVATLGVAGVGYVFWAETDSKRSLVRWLIVAVCAVLSLLFGWFTLSWALKVVANLGRKLVLDADGIALERDHESTRYRWDEIRHVDRDDRMNEQSYRHGIILALIQHHMGWLLHSKLSIHMTDDHVMIITPYFDRYDEICERVRRGFRRRARESSSAENADS